jgi:hypothetical protein
MAFRSGISGNPGGKLRRMADAAGVRPVAAPPVGTVGLQNRFAGMMSKLEIAIHMVILVSAVFGVILSLAGIGLWWISRKLNRLT